MAKKRVEVSKCAGCRNTIAEATLQMAERRLEIRKLNIQNVKLRERIEVLEEALIFGGRPLPKDKDD